MALADYCASGQNEVSLKEGDKLELLKMGSAGWWYVKLLREYLIYMFEISNLTSRGKEVQSL